MITGLTGWLIAGGAALLGLLFTYMRGTLDGAKKERAKQDRARIEAIEEANEIQNDVGALPSGEAREELKRWARG